MDSELYQYFFATEFVDMFPQTNGDILLHYIDYRLVEGISRKIVRLKKYEDGIYNTEEYQHFAVIHVRLPQSGIIYDVEIELNEFQVQIAIDKLPTYKIGEDLVEKFSVNEHKENEAVI